MFFENVHHSPKKKLVGQIQFGDRKLTVIFFLINEDAELRYVWWT